MALVIRPKNTGPKNTTRHRRLGVKLLLAFIATIVLFAGIALLNSPTWTQVDWLLAHRFADIESISTDQLEKLLLDARQNPRATKPVLLDIRSAEEFAVSRIPGARHMPPDTVVDFAERELASLDRSQLIVVYCAVGMRSAAAARDLKFLGFTQVKNLRGSLFQWANEGRALEGATAVHPYNDYWGQLLQIGVRLK